MCSTQNDFRAADAIEIAENFCFDFNFLGGGFDHKITVGELSNARATVTMLWSVDSFHVRSNLVLRNFAIEILTDGRQATIQKTLLHIAQHHSNPQRAKTWAMPLPMVPAPMTPTRWISMAGPPLAENPRV